MLFDKRLARGVEAITSYFSGSAVLQFLQLIILSDTRTSPDKTIVAKVASLIMVFILGGGFSTVW